MDGSDSSIRAAAQAAGLARWLRETAERLKGVPGVRRPFPTFRDDPYDGLVRAVAGLKADAVVGAAEQAGPRGVGSVAVHLVEADDGR